MDIVLLTPVYNDWSSVDLLIRESDRVLQRAGRRVRVVIVDDGSSQENHDILHDMPVGAVSSIDIVHLRCNLGHQRAIAIGLAHVEATMRCDAVVVLDGDGEDRPEDVDRLLKALESQNGRAVVFAERTRRSEGLVFKFFYWLYRTAHRALVGERVRVGNFAAVPSRALARLVAMSALWNHFAAAVFQSRMPYTMVPTVRGVRYDGRSHMNAVSLVTHGLSAMSVFGDRIGVRLLVAVASFVSVVVASGAAIVGWHLWAGVALPSWAPYVALFTLLALQAASIFLVFVFIILAGRGALGFVPRRDYVHYVLTVAPVPLQPRDVTSALRRD